MAKKSYSSEPVRQALLGGTEGFGLLAALPVLAALLGLAVLESGFAQMLDYTLN